MRYVRIKNQELKDPYCEVISNTMIYRLFYDKFGSEVIIPREREYINPKEHKVLEGYIIFCSNGEVYYERRLWELHDPIDYIDKLDWEEFILPMVGSPEFPSAELRSYRTNKLLKKSYLEKNKKKEE